MLCLSVFELYSGWLPLTNQQKLSSTQYTDFYSCNPPGVKKGFIKGEALRLLRTNSSQITFERNIINFQNRLLERGSCRYFKKVPL